MCLYPTLRLNKKYVANKKNGGKVPPFPVINGKVDKRVMYVPTKCNKCFECKKQKAREWSIRLTEDIKHNRNGIFVTLTFSNKSFIELRKDVIKKAEDYIEGYEMDNAIAKLAVRRFLERHRKHYGKSVRHWLVTELGHNGTENVHLHGFLWTDLPPQRIKELWKYGYCWLSNDKGGYVNNKTVNYCVKYLHKQDALHPNYEPKMFNSAGIGNGYRNSIDFQNSRYKGKNTREQYIYPNGQKGGLPVYYRNALYSEEEREKLWIQKLDKQTRYVDGVKIDVSQGEDKYLKTLEVARRKNGRLNFGNDQINWEKRRHENYIRNLKHLQRLKQEKWKES